MYNIVNTLNIKIGSIENSEDNSEDVRGDVTSFEGQWYNVVGFARMWVNINHWIKHSFRTRMTSYIGHRQCIFFNVLNIKQVCMW